MTSVNSALAPRKDASNSYSSQLENNDRNEKKKTCYFVITVVMHAVLSAPLVGLIQAESNQSTIDEYLHLRDSLDSVLHTVQSLKFAWDSVSMTITDLISSNGKNTVDEIADKSASSFNKNMLHPNSIILQRPLAKMMFDVVITFLHFIFPSNEAHNNNSSIDFECLNLMWRRRLSNFHSYSINDTQSFLLSVVLKLFASSTSSIFFSAKNSMTCFSSPPKSQMGQKCLVCSTYSPFLSHLCLLKVTALHCISDLVNIHGSICVDRFLPLIHSLMGAQHDIMSTTVHEALAYPCSFVQSLALAVIGMAGSEKFLVPVGHLQAHEPLIARILYGDK